VSRRCLALLIVALLAVAPQLAFGKQAKRSAHPTAKKRSSAPAPAGEGKEGKKERASSNTSAASDSEGGDDSSQDSSESSTTTTTPAAGGGKVKSKTYTFGAMDVEGKLKTPQLLYFLNRVKLELDMSAPDKRSFMKELQQSADDKNL
jgi:hypothetical protein